MAKCHVSGSLQSVYSRVCIYVYIHVCVCNMTTVYYTFDIVVINEYNNTEIAYFELYNHLNCDILSNMLMILGRTCSSHPPCVSERNLLTRQLVSIAEMYSKYI